VRLSPFLYLLNEWRYSNETDDITCYQIYKTLVTLIRSLGQRSSSPSDGRRNLVNVIASRPRKGFEPKLTQISPTVGSQTITCQGREFTGQGHRKHFPKIRSKTADPYPSTARRRLLSSLFAFSFIVFDFISPFVYDFMMDKLLTFTCL